MWWRPRQSEIPIDRITPLYPAFPFVEEEPLPERRKSPDSEKRPIPSPKQAAALPEAAISNAVLQSLSQEEARQKYAVYTRSRLKSYFQPPVGILLDRKA